MNKPNKENNLSNDNEARSKLFNFYENIKNGNQIFSDEELEIAIETLKLAQQTVKQNNQSNKPKIKANELKKRKENITSGTAVDNDSDKEDANRNKTLPLPIYNWFVTIHDGKPESNVFTGSCRKDTNKSYLTTTTFNYKVSVSNVGKENAKIIASCFWQLPWWKGAVKTNTSQSEYECSANGLNEATAWLNSEWQKFIKDDKND